MDRVTAQARSRIMALVGSRHGRTTEKRLRAHLVQQGIKGWTMNDPALPGRPDFVFRKTKLSVFVDGCFWHGCRKCQKGSKSNSEFWNEKFTANRKRDARAARKLRQMGWSVIRIRECDLKNQRRVSRIVEALKDRLR